MAFSKTIQMYIFDGNPNGRIMCELSNWNGRVYKVARNEISKFSERPDANNTGIYFLYGKSDENKDAVYIGEAEKIAFRLKQHLTDDFYWNDCVAIISKDNLLNKAHVKYLENKFYTMASNARRYAIQNTTIPTLSSVSEYDEAMLEEFISNAKLLVNTLGYKTFESIEESIFHTQNDKIIFHIHAARGASAKGYAVADGFVVEKGSVIASDVTRSISDYIVRYRETLLNDGTIDDSNTFVKDFLFTSPSLVAAIIMGRNANGRTEWKTSDGITFKSIEENSANED